MSLFFLYLIVYFFHANAGDGEQFFATVFRLGWRWDWCPTCSSVFGLSVRLRHTPTSKRFLSIGSEIWGFCWALGWSFAVFGTLDYAQVFADAPAATNTVLPSSPPGWDLMTAICLLLFVGAMGKSAQFPLHVWLPDSMEGPTPISALIHAATMVTAGIFMVARMSPLFELSATALTVVLAVGAITAFFMGLLGLVQNDIKRVIAYSTLSQLGYMTAALGASAYSAAMFHLFTHAFFKALLFLAAGSVIIAMHHEQDMRKMGGLRRYMPVTYVTVILGSLALAGVPPFAGFYSKDVIIEAVGASALPGATLAHWALVIGAFITALYSFRLLMLTFHGPCRMDEHTREALRESPSTVTVPLVLLAVPSVFAGFLLVTPMLGGGFFDALFLSPKAMTQRRRRLPKWAAVRWRC